MMYSNWFEIDEKRPSAAILSLSESVQSSLCTMELSNESFLYCWNFMFTVVKTVTGWYRC